MKNYKNNLFIVLSVLLFSVVMNSGCKKVTLNDALPVLKMVSVQPFGNDSVVVTGTITANSTVDIQYEGFCYGTDAVPAITENQVLYQTDSTTFSAHIYVNPANTYYFRCFAANSFGYAISVPLK